MLAPSSVIIISVQTDPAEYVLRLDAFFGVLDTPEVDEARLPLLSQFLGQHFDFIQFSEFREVLVQVFRQGVLRDFTDVDMSCNRRAEIQPTGATRTTHGGRTAAPMPLVATAAARITRF
jgi:hypothetical protein